MPYQKIYSRINWENYPSDATPLNENNLNKLDVAADEIDNRVIGLDTTKLDKITGATMVKDVSYDPGSGIFTVKYLNGTAYNLDTKLEKLAVNFAYDYRTQQLIITLDDGTKQYVDMSALITQYEFTDTDTIDLVIDGTGKVSAMVKDGSIGEHHLRPDYLADIRVEMAKAQASQTAAAASESAARTSETNAKSYAEGGTGTRLGEDEDNAKYYMEQAKKQTGGIPTKLSELQNDTEFVTASVDNLINYYEKSNVYTSTEVDDKLSDYLIATGDAGNTTVTFTEATDLAELASGEKQSTLFGKLKLTVKNVISILKLLGSTDISGIGDGTVTGAISGLNSNLTDMVTQGKVCSLTSDFGTVSGGYVINGNVCTVMAMINNTSEIPVSNNTQAILRGLPLSLAYFPTLNISSASSGTYYVATILDNTLLYMRGIEVAYGSIPSGKYVGVSGSYIIAE